MNLVKEVEGKLVLVARVMFFQHSSKNVWGGGKGDNSRTSSHSCKIMPDNVFAFLPPWEDMGRGVVPEM